MATKAAQPQPPKAPQALTQAQEDAIVAAYLQSGIVPDDVESISLTRTPRVIMKAT